MALRRLRAGELLTAAGAIGLLVVMFVDWFGDQSAWESLTIGRVLLVVIALLALSVVILTVSRPVAMACSAASITVGVGVPALMLTFYRVVVNEPGPNAAVSLRPGAYLGLLFVVAIVVGAWRALADERTGAATSQRQTERVLAVRGAPRPVPPPRDPSRPSRSERSD